MIDFSNFEKINDQAYVWRQFLDADLSEACFEESLNFSQGPEGFEKVVRDRDKVELLGCGHVDERVVLKVNDFFEGTIYETSMFLHWYTPDGIWFAVHRDDEGTDSSPLKKTWAGVIYLEDLDGGVLFYPTSNTYYYPKKGDMVIHSASLPHGATPVVGGNKRTITYVVYDKTTPVDPNRPNPTEMTMIKDRQVYESKEFLESEIGKWWIKDFNVVLP